MARALSDRLVSHLLLGWVRLVHEVVRLGVDVKDLVLEGSKELADIPGAHMLSTVSDRFDTEHSALRKNHSHNKNGFELVCRAVLLLNGHSHGKLFDNSGTWQNGNNHCHDIGVNHAFKVGS